MKDCDCTSESQPKVEIKKPEQCTKTEKEEFIKLAESAGQNRKGTPRRRFDELVWVGLLSEGDDIKSISSLKEGDREVFRQAGFKDKAGDYYEVRFSFTKCNSRKKGYNKKLNKELFEKAKNDDKRLYCTIRKGNDPSIATFKSLGFKEEGNPYKGIETDVYVQLFIKSE